MKAKIVFVLAILTTLSLLLTACGSNSAPAAATDKFAEVKGRGTLVIATDAN